MLPIANAPEGRIEIARPRARVALRCVEGVAEGHRAGVRLAEQALTLRDRRALGGVPIGGARADTGHRGRSLGPRPDRRQSRTSASQSLFPARAGPPDGAGVKAPANKAAVRRSRSIWPLWPPSEPVPWLRRRRSQLATASAPSPRSIAPSHFGAQGPVRRYGPVPAKGTDARRRRPGWVAVPRQPDGRRPAPPAQGRKNRNKMSIEGHRRRRSSACSSFTLQRCRPSARTPGYTADHPRSRPVGPRRARGVRDRREGGHADVRGAPRHPGLRLLPVDLGPELTGRPRRGPSSPRSSPRRRRSGASSGWRRTSGAIASPHPHQRPSGRAPCVRVRD